MIRLFALALLLGGLSACDDVSGGSAGALRTGTWGGDDAGMIVTDSGAHVHLGCTLGDVPEQIVLDGAGRFDVPGRYNLTAYPVDQGIYHPARFEGALRLNGLSLTVTVTDTIAQQTVVVGPAVVVYGREPQLGPCPICRTAPPLQ